MKIHWLFALIIVLSLFIYAFIKRRKKGLLLCFIFCFLGFSFSSFDQLEPYSNETYQGFVVVSKENYFLINVKGQKYYVYQKEHDFERNDYLKIRGYHRLIQMTTYESRFDFSSYLSDQGVFYEIKPKEITRSFSFPLSLEKYRKNFLNKFDEDSKILLDAFLFSSKHYDHELIIFASNLNLIYLFSLSSLYLRILILAFENLLFLKLSRKRAQVITFLFFLPLFIFSFIKVSIRKICFLYILKHLNDFYFKKKLPYLKLLTYLAFGFLLFDFHLAYQLSFLLSFGLSFLFIFLRNFLSRISPKKRKFYYPFIMFVFLLPLHIKASGEFHLLQFFMQLIVLPLHLIFLLFSIVSLYFYPLIKTIGFFSRLFFNVYSLLNKVDITLITGAPSVAFYVLFYGMFFLFIYLKEINLKKQASLVFLMLPLLLIVSSLPIRNFYEQAIYFINVGQGDAILIKNYQYHVLVDTGGNLQFDMAEEVLIPFFKKKKILKLDALITTHNDFDHSGAASSLIEKYRVKNYFTQKDDFPLSFGALVLENLNLLNYDNDNDNSLVLYFKLMEKEWLLMGDASQIVEKDIITHYPHLSCDYLKIGHHGSNTSTSENFLKTLLPSEAIISCGLNNPYHHPHPDVLFLLEKYHIKIRRTDYEGSICYSSLTF